MDSQTVGLFDFLNQQVDALSVGQGAVFIQVGVEKDVGDNRGQTGFFDHLVPQLDGLFGDIRSAFQHLVGQDFDTFRALFPDEPHNIFQVHPMVQIFVL